MSYLFAPYKSLKKAWDDTAVNLMAGESHLLMNAGRYVGLHGRLRVLLNLS